MAGQPDYMRFTLDASMFPAEAYYDYIVVGGGTAGCPLAATLSKSYQVLVLERGGAPSEFPSLVTQEGFLSTLVDADRSDSPAQPFVSEDGVPNARGRVLGGSSAINAGFYSRGHPGFFDSSGVYWDMAVVNNSFEWVERRITFRPELQSWQSAVRDGLLEANVTPYNGYSVHHLQGTKIGASTFDSSGRRHSAADLLDFASPENIRVALRALVVRILLGSSSSGPHLVSPCFFSFFTTFILEEPIRSQVLHRYTRGARQCQRLASCTGTVMGKTTMRGRSLAGR